MHNNRETIEERICELLAQGHSLAAICRRKNLPAPSTIYKWLAESPGFSERYAHAREQQGKHGFCPSPIQGAIRARARTTGSNDTVFMRRASGSDTRTRANNRKYDNTTKPTTPGAIRARARTTGAGFGFQLFLQLLERYAHAREQQADFYADEIIEIADNCPPETGEVAKAKLKIDARKWKAARLAPKKYSEKAELDLKSTDGSMTPIKITRVIIDPKEVPQEAT